MYAVVVRETGQREAIEGSAELLTTSLLPRVREAPGIVSASFMSDGDGATLNVLVFETEEAARAALQLTRNAPRPGFLELESADLYRARLGAASRAGPSYSRAMTVLRMDNILLVVDDLEAVKAFFVDLGLELEGEADVGGESVDRLIGLEGVRATIASMRTPDGTGRIELDKFHTPAAVRLEPEDAPVNALGLRRIMFAVDDIETVLGRLRSHGAELVGEVVQYEDQYRLCYVRGPEGIIVALAEQRT